MYWANEPFLISEKIDELIVYSIILHMIMGVKFPEQLNNLATFLLIITGNGNLIKEDLNTRLCERMRKMKIII